MIVTPCYCNHNVQTDLKVSAQTAQVRAIARDERNMVMVVKRSVRTTLAARVATRSPTSAGARSRIARWLSTPHAL